MKRMVFLLLILPWSYLYEGKSFSPKADLTYSAAIPPGRKIPKCGSELSRLNKKRQGSSQIFKERYGTAKPLLGIASKEYCKIPSPRLQRMKLKLEKYNLTFTYRPGKDMHIADLLSRNLVNNQHEEPEIKELTELVHTVNLSQKRKKQF